MKSCADLSHCVTALVDAPARAAFDFLADPLALGRWSLGCMNTRPAEQKGLYMGSSLLDGAQAWFAIDARPELLQIDYRIGTPDRFVPRISARVIAPEVCELPANQCYVTLIAWRSSGMSAERWQVLCALHEAEIRIIKAQIESAVRRGSRP